MTNDTNRYDRRIIARGSGFCLRQSYRKADNSANQLRFSVFFCFGLFALLAACESKQVETHPEMVNRIDLMKEHIQAIKEEKNK